MEDLFAWTPAARRKSISVASPHVTSPHRWAVSTCGQATEVKKMNPPDCLVSSMASLSCLIHGQTAAANWQVRLPRPLQLPERHVMPVQDTRAHMHTFGLGADGGRRSSRFRSLRRTCRGPARGSVHDGARVCVGTHAVRVLALDDQRDVTRVLRTWHGPVSLADANA